MSSHSELVSIADAHVWSRKTFNNAIGALPFEFGFRDHLQHHNEAQANYDEFRFFTGLRPSEEIALLICD